MDTKNLLGELRNQRNELDVVIRYLERTSNGHNSARIVKEETAGPKTRRGMSAAARARISRAMKARWAARKKAAKKS